jgi:hypothetical protein
VNYFSDERHASWRLHYTRGNNGGVLLSFTHEWRAANLPLGIGEKGYEHGKHQFLVVLKDNQTGLLHDTRMSVAYNEAGSHEPWAMDADWNSVDGLSSLQSYFYGMHHCPCHRKQDARDQCGVDVDDACEGNRFVIERITPLDRRDLILYSETATEDELEQALELHRQAPTPEAPVNDQKDDPNSDRAADNTERIVHLLRRMFHVHFCDKESVPQEMKPKVEPFYFCGWLDRHLGEYDQVTECDAAKVPHKTWDIVKTMCDRGMMPEQIYPVWYAIVLSDRGEPKNPVKDVNIVLNVTYQDGTIATTQAFMSQEMLGEGSKFNDAVLFSMIRSNITGILQSMAALGIDAMHAQSAADNTFTHPTQDPYDLMMGFLVKFLLKGEPFPQSQDGTPAAYKMEPNLHKAVTTYVRLAQQLIRPKLPPHAVAAIKRKQMLSQAESAGKPRGGWDA